MSDNEGSDSLPAFRGTAGQTGGYRSNAEMIAAMQDPRYKKDEAYRADVMAKVNAMYKG